MYKCTSFSSVSDRFKSTYRLLKPTKKYDIIYELMKRHKTLSGELRSAFYNPRDAKYVYLEAKFTKLGISSLYEVLREFSALKRSSLAPVPEPDLKKCLTIGDEPRKVFTAGQWVQINQGLYRGDIGFLVDEFPNEDLITLFNVLVIPRLEFAYPDDDESKPSKRQWKRQVRPSPRLFNPDECIQEDLIQQGDQIYSYEHYSFKYGLQVKTYSERTLSLAVEISPLNYSLFKTANDKGAEIDLSSIPIRSFWRFEPGERVVIYPSNRIGTIASSFNPVDTRCQVELEEEGVHLVFVKDIRKDIVPGHYVELLAGIHTGKKGFVIGRAGDRLAIWFDNQVSSIWYTIPSLYRSHTYIGYAGTHKLCQAFKTRLLPYGDALAEHPCQTNVGAPGSTPRCHHRCYGDFLPISSDHCSSTQWR